MPETDKTILTVLTYICTGLIKWRQRLQNNPYPYPDELAIGINKLSGIFIEKGMDYPGDIGSALKLFTTPISSWGIINDFVFNNEDVLIKNGEPSELCYEFALQCSNIEDELTQRVLVDVMQRCRREGKPEDYTMFRKMIIENPYMSKNDIMGWSLNWNNCCASEYIKDAYEDIPPLAITDGKCYACGNCGWIIEWRKGIASCLSHSCREETNDFKDIKELEVDYKKFMRLKRGVMRFIARPGIYELNLEKKLLKLGVDVEMWPNYDAYDLKLTFPDGECWAVDVKDWGNPYLLAKKSGKFKDEPKWDKAFFVIPQYRKRKCSDYKEIFIKNYEFKNANIEFEQGFIRKVKTKLEEVEK